MPRPFFIFPSTSSVASTEMILHAFHFCCVVKWWTCVYSQHASGLAEDAAARFCEVSSKKILWKGPVVPGTIKCIRSKSEVNGKIQDRLLQQKVIYTQRLCQPSIQNLPHTSVS